MKMKPKKNISATENDQQVIIFAYFKIIYEKAWTISEFALTYLDSSRNERLDMYYQEFRTFLLRIVTLDNFDTWRDIVRKLPANLNEETLLEDLDNWQQTKSEANEGLQILNELSKTQISLSPWLENAIHNIDGWIKPPVDLDDNLIHHSFDKLVAKVKEINEQVQGKLVIEQDGSATFYSPDGDQYAGIIKKDTNEYKMLEFLNRTVGKVKSPAEIESNFNLSKGYKNAKLRTRDTAVAVKNSLRLLKTDEIFIVNNGYGLKYPVEFK